ncbi:C40 family peptidase [Eilatimonas milleporae]|uniref:NlpC/P60 family protein n=1 Tax=Eilatimonas milleporae TaxID=911205 RepID=A0A3M0CSP7_9PROT|nr:NlpC/P60 family protein [Eilatimonas milleporae]RMB11905.1 NlpC/P60 family protein [Eilatimonas milleporae]
MFDYRPYLAIPFVPHGRDRSGCDCWGLVCLVYRDCFNVSLPPFDRAVGDVNNPLSVAPVMAAGAAQDIWVKSDTPRAGDVLLFGTRAAPYHVGLYVNGDLMLHTRAGTDATTERWRGCLWDRRLIGFFRHRLLCDETRTAQSGAHRPAPAA